MTAYHGRKRRKEKRTNITSTVQQHCPLLLFTTWVHVKLLVLVKKAKKRNAVLQLVLIKQTYCFYQHKYLISDKLEKECQKSCRA